LNVRRISGPPRDAVKENRNNNFPIWAASVWYVQLIVNPEDFDYIQSHGGDPVQHYSAAIELAMITFYSSLREKDQRRYAAVEAEKLGHGGIEYLSSLLGCDPKTIRQGQADLKALPPLPPERCRKKGADEST
jgi:hypothetical protein